MGITGTTYTDTAPTSYLKREVLDGFVLKNPDADSLTVFLQRMKGMNLGVKNPEVEFYETDNIGRWTYAPSGFTAANTSIDIPANDAWMAQVYTLLYVPRTGETMWVSAVSSGHLTVTRSWGDAAAAAGSSNEIIQVIGKAYPENGTLQDDGNARPVRKTTYTQIFRNSWDVSGTMQSTEQYGLGNTVKEEKKKTFLQHISDQEQACIFGAKVSTGTGSSGNLVRTTPGLMEVISTNVSDFGGTMGELAFQNAVRPVYEVGSPEKIFLGSVLTCQVVSNYSTMKLQTSVLQETYGNRVKKYVSAAGDLTILPSRMTLRGPHQSKFFVLDPTNLKRVFLTGNGNSRDTSIIEYKQESTQVDGIKGEYMTEAGFVIQLEDSHMRGDGVTG